MFSPFCGTRLTFFLLLNHIRDLTLEARSHFVLTAGFILARKIDHTKVIADQFPRHAVTTASAGSGWNKTLDLPPSQSVDWSS